MIGPDLYSFRALWRHYRQCRRNKRTTANALAFEVNAEANLLALQQELRTHTYRPGRSICFITDGPKPREVFKATLYDIIVKRTLKCRHYLRYVDDMVLLAQDRETVVVLRHIDFDGCHSEERSDEESRYQSVVS